MGEQLVGSEYVKMTPAADKSIWSASVNKKEFELLINSNAVLLDVLRDQVGTLGVKRGCGSGTCHWIYRDTAGTPPVLTGPE